MSQLLRMQIPKLLIRHACGEMPNAMERHERVTDSARTLEPSENKDTVKGTIVRLGLRRNSLDFC